MNNTHLQPTEAAVAKAKEIVERVRQGESGESLFRRLPHFAGYSQDSFSSDILEAFREPTQHMRDLHKTVDAWQHDEANLNQKRYGSLGKFMAKDQCAEMYKFVSRFRRSIMRQQFMDAAGGDADAAAEGFLKWASQEAKNGRLGGKGGKGDELGKALNKMLEQHGGTDPNQAEPVPFLKEGGSPGGKQAGAGHTALIARKMRIAELLPIVRRRYEFAAVKGVKLEPVPHPEDDMEFREMRLHSEVLRSSMQTLALPDELYNYKLATKQIQVREYLRATEQPKKFTLLLDVSGSMAESIEGYQIAEWATAVGIALCEQARYGSNQVILIRFDGNAHEPVTGSPERIAAELWKCEFSGGGTCFEQAFRASDKHSPDAVVMITDGSSSFSKPPHGPLHTMLCSTGDGGLKEISAKFYQIAG